MKKVSTFVFFRTAIITVFGLGGLIFAVAFIGNRSQTFRYKGSDHTVAIIAPQAEENEAKFEANEGLSSADFDFDEDGLVEINNFQLHIALDALSHPDSTINREFHTLLGKHQAHEIIFKQSRAMVLPKMQMIHLVGELTIGKLSRNMVFQLAYHINPQDEIQLGGKQSFKLSDFGLVSNNEILSPYKDRLEFTIDMYMDREEPNPL